MAWHRCPVGPRERCTAAGERCGGGHHSQLLPVCAKVDLNEPVSNNLIRKVLEL